MKNDLSLKNLKTVIVANGKFPEHDIPLRILAEADIVVCCDGAINKIDKYGINPTAIVGDLDSLTPEIKVKYAEKLFYDADQESNDLTKAVKWCLNNDFENIDIIGATGLREDHTLGNISLLTLYAQMGVKVRMLTDNGVLIPLLKSNTIKSIKGQQVSIFSPNNLTRVTSTNLKYSIQNRTLDDYWMGTLNESLGDDFYLDFSPGPIIVFFTY